MSQHVWRLGKLAWMRGDCIPYGGKIEGWTRLVSRLFWCSGYSREFEIRSAYRQGWCDANGTERERDFGRIVSLTDAHADYYVGTILGDDAMVNAGLDAIRGNIVRGEDR